MKLKLSPKFGRQIKEKVKTRNGLDFKSINAKMDNAKFFITSTPTSLSIIIEDIRILTLNEMLATAQTRKYEMFPYKKNVHNMMEEILRYFQSKGGVLPKFKAVNMFLFRESPRFIDNDSFAASFKYIIDGLVGYEYLGETKLEKLLQDDNPTYIKSITPIQVKKSGNTTIGIRLESTEDNSSQVDIYKQWGFDFKTITNHSAEDREKYPFLKLSLENESLTQQEFIEEL